METTQNYSIVFSFAAGVLSFFSPCILPLIPAYLSYITGVSIENMKDGKPRKKFFACFILYRWIYFYLHSFRRFSHMAWKISPCKPKSYTDYRRDSRHLIGTAYYRHLKITPYMQAKIQIKRLASGYPAHFLSVWYLRQGGTPCVGPVLASILIVASSQETVLRGILLLVFYSIGIGIPFLITTLDLNKILGVLSFITRYARAFEILTGLLLMVMGLLLVLNKLTYLIPL